MKTYSERLKYVEDIVENENLTEVQIEKFGDYLLTSKDLDSHRKIEDRFYLNDKEFRRYKESNVLLCNTDKLDHIANENNQIITGVGQRFSELFQSYEIKKEKLISNYDKVIALNLDEAIRASIEEIVSEVIENVKSGIDLLCLNYLLFGYSQTEIANKLSISRLFIHRIIKRICK
ncbi:TPA: hypothetical protein ACGO1T_000520 [Streptococcus suis]